MLTSKYHIGSIVAIFFALGIGILLGGTLGQKWMFHTEDNIVRTLMDKYEAQAAENQRLQKQIGSLQLMNQALSPVLEHKTIWWVHPGGEKNEMLEAIMTSAGAEWVDRAADGLFPYGRDEEAWSRAASRPDIIVVSDPAALRRLRAELGNRAAEGGPVPQIIDVGDRGLRLDEPQAIVDFILFLRKMIEEEPHAAVGVYRYSGLE